MNSDRLLAVVGLVCSIGGIVLGGFVSIYANEIKEWIGRRIRAGKQSRIKTYIEGLTKNLEYYENLVSNPNQLGPYVAWHVVRELRITVLFAVGALCLYMPLDRIIFLMARNERDLSLLLAKTLGYGTALKLSFVAVLLMVLGERWNSIYQRITRHLNLDTTISQLQDAIRKAETELGAATD